MRGLKAEKAQMITQEQLPKALLNAAHVCMIQLIPVTTISCLSLTIEKAPPVPLELQPLLQHYQDVFQEPKSYRHLVGTLTTKLL